MNITGGFLVMSVFVSIIAFSQFAYSEITGQQLKEAYDAKHEKEQAARHGGRLVRALLEHRDRGPDDQDREHEPEDELVVLAASLELGDQAHGELRTSNRLDSFQGVRASTGMIVNR